MITKKTTKEISEDYNHKAPDSLLNGNEVWFRKDEIQKRLEEIYIACNDERVFEIQIRLSKLLKDVDVPLSPDVKCAEFNEVFISGASTKKGVCRK